MRGRIHIVDCRLRVIGPEAPGEPADVADRRRRLLERRAELEDELRATGAVVGRPVLFDPDESF